MFLNMSTCILSDKQKSWNTSDKQFDWFDNNSLYIYNTLMWVGLGVWRRYADRTAGVTDPADQSSDCVRWSQTCEQ